MGAPQIDLLAFVPGETLLELLQRQEPARGWIADAGTGEPVAPYDETLPYPWAIKVRPLFSSAQFLAWADARTAATRPILLPPVWPGATAVTLGTPVALSSSLVVTGPLDGVIVHVTNSPAGLGRFVIGGFTYFYKLGEVSFVTDGSYVEPWQYIGWDHGLYCPRSQKRATSALLRGLAGVTGTATPWLIT